MSVKYFIDGDLLTCTVCNDAGLAFYSSVSVSEYPTIGEAIDSALSDAEKARDAYNPQGDTPDRLITDN